MLGQCKARLAAKPATAGRVLAVYIADQYSEVERV
jgi:hypothetical protein